MNAALPGGWSIEQRAGTAAVLHGPWPEPQVRAGRVAAVCSVRGRALVLGSTQHVAIVDTERALHERVDVVRRGSGGGAVFVAPGEQVWLDVWIPRHDALWEDDIIGSSRWLGDMWRRALGTLGVGDLTVHTARSAPSQWAPLVCFAGVGPGEVTTATAKVVGVAQRRTRDGARFHSMAYVRWDPSALTALLALGPERARRAARELPGLATGLDAVVPSTRRDAEGSPVVALVQDALLAALV